MAREGHHKTLSETGGGEAVAGILRKCARPPERRNVPELSTLIGRLDLTWKTIFFHACRRVDHRRQKAGHVVADHAKNRTRRMRRTRSHAVASLKPIAPNLLQGEIIYHLQYEWTGLQTSTRTPATGAAVDHQQKSFSQCILPTSAALFSSGKVLLRQSLFSAKLKSCVLE